MQIFERIKKIIKSNLIETPNRLDSEIYFDEDFDSLKREIEEAYRQKFGAEHEVTTSTNEISLQDAFRILGVESNSPKEVIRQAYIKKVKQYHPDLVQNLGPEIQKLAKQKLQEINLAYEIIQKHM